MKKFEFSLESLRRLRQQQEQSAMIEYGAAMAALETARKQLRTIEAEMDAAAAIVQARLQENCPAAELAQLHQFYESIELQKKSSGRAVNAAQERLQLALAKLLAARKATAIVEKYHEKQKRAYLNERQKHEQKILDDLTRRPSPHASRITHHASH